MPIDNDAVKALQRPFVEGTRQTNSILNRGDGPSPGNLVIYRQLVRRHLAS
jgi:hypothetical protein